MIFDYMKFGLGMALAITAIPLGLIVMLDGEIKVGLFILLYGLLGAALAYFTNKATK